MKNGAPIPNKAASYAGYSKVAVSKSLNNQPLQSVNAVIVILPLSASNCQQSVATSQNDPALLCGRWAHPGIKKQTRGDAHTFTKRTTKVTPRRAKDGARGLLLNKQSH